MDIPAFIHGNATAYIVRDATHALGPDKVAVAVKHGDKDIQVAMVGHIEDAGSRIEVRYSAEKAAREGACGIDVACVVQRNPIACVATRESAQFLGPNKVAVAVQLGYENVVGANYVQVEGAGSWIEVYRAREGARGVDIAATVHGNTITRGTSRDKLCVGSSITHTLGPDEVAITVQLGDEDT